MNQDVFFDTVRRTLFGGKLAQSQVDGMNGLLTAFGQVGDRDQDTLAYGLATAFHETGRRMIPVREGFAKTDAGARRAVNNLAQKRGPKSAVARYAKPTGPHGHVYYGRGHVQLTWLENYRSSSADAGVDLVANPDAMLDPVVSARVLFKGLQDGRWNGQGKGLSDYEGADDVLSDAEAAEARRTVNGKDKAAAIAVYHRKFYEALSAAGWKASTGAAGRAGKATVSPQAPKPATAAPVVTPAPAKPAPAKKTAAPAKDRISFVQGVVTAASLLLAAWVMNATHKALEIYHWLTPWN